MATDTQLEAQRLVSISLTKMAQSRSQRTGISLHKSLLVATVLQKARYLCMEDLFRMVHSSPVYQQHASNVNMASSEQQCYNFEDDDEHLIALTPEEAGITTDQPEPHMNVVGFSDLVVTTTSGGVVVDEVPFTHTATAAIPDELNSEYDKENMAPETRTYFDLDKTPRDQQCFRERSSSITSSSAASYCKNLKRRRAVCDSETEEAVQSILPKKTRMLSFDSDCDDSVFGDDDPFLGAATGGCSDPHAIFVGSSSGSSCGDDDDDIGSKSMDIDRITSLVSIFSFGGLTPSSSSNNLADSSAMPSSSNGGTNSSYGNLTRSSSTPDLCSAQAKESDSLPPRPFIAMTV